MATPPNLQSYVHEMSMAGTAVMPSPEVTLAGAHNYLVDRVDELERRVADLEAALGGAGD